MDKKYEVHIRFSDIDAFGHVHNAAYFQYFESARVQCFQEILGHDWDWNRFGFVLVENYAQYLHPLFLNDQAQISINVTKLGNKSFTLGYQLCVDGKEHCTGQSTLVCFNHELKKSINIPQTLKKHLIQWK